MRGVGNYPLTLEQWMEEATTGSGVNVLALDCQIAQRAARLPEHHKDPADRLIIATALSYKLDLLSLDSAFPAYQELGNHLINT